MGTTDRDGLYQALDEWFEQTAGPTSVAAAQSDTLEADTPKARINRLYGVCNDEQAGIDILCDAAATDPDPGVRTFALRRLGARWHPVSVARAAMADPDAGVREAALLELRNAADSHENVDIRFVAVARCIALNDATDRLRIIALRELAAHGQTPGEHLDVVRSVAFHDPESDVRRAALDVLAAAGDLEAVRFVAGCDPHLGVRRQALEHLPVAQCAEWINDLATGDRDPSMREWARDILETAASGGGQAAGTAPRMG